MISNLMFSFLLYLGNHVFFQVASKRMFYNFPLFWNPINLLNSKPIFFLRFEASVVPLFTSAACSHM